MAKLVFGMNHPWTAMSIIWRSCQARRSSVTSSRRRRGKRAVCTVAKCMRLCVTGTTIILNGTQRNTPLRWRGETSRNGWSRAVDGGGPNARLVEDDLAGAICKLKAERDGEIEVAGPTLAHSLTELGLIDKYRIYLHPVVLGHGKPYFAGPRPPLRLMTHDRIGEDVIRLTYVPA